MSDKCRDIWVYVETGDDGTALGGIELFRLPKSLLKTQAALYLQLLQEKILNPLQMKLVNTELTECWRYADPGYQNLPLKAMHANLKSSFPCINRKRSSSLAAVFAGIWPECWLAA